MRFAGSWAEVIVLGVAVVGLVGLRLHITCNVKFCPRRELSPTGFCRHHQYPPEEP